MISTFARADILCDVRCQVGESPLCSAAEQALYWVDIEGRALHRVGADSGRRQWPTAERITCIALHGQGGLLAAMETGLFRLQPTADDVHVHGVPHGAIGARRQEVANDLR